MANILDSLQGTSRYPFPQQTLIDTAVGRGLDPNAEVTTEILSSRSYRLAEADLLMWLSVSPNVVQGEQHYAWNTEQRKYLRDRANDIYNAEDDPENPSTKINYGYKGCRL